MAHDCSDRKQLSFKLPNGENGTLPMWQQRTRSKTPPSSPEFTGYQQMLETAAKFI